MELDELKNLVRTGEFGAITLDTSIFVAQGLKLESGLLKQLEQFRDSSKNLIISEIVKEEILSHLTGKTKDAKREIEKSLKQARDCWQIEDYELEKIKEKIFGKRDVPEIVTERFNKFVEATSLEVIEAKNYLIVSDLIQKYFRSEPPFSKIGKKKNEFPDAIALISLEEWANKNKTKVIVVTSDEDWKNFCKSSDKLYVRDDLAGALALFQLDADADAICKSLSEKYESGDLKSVKEAIFDALEDKLDGFSIYGSIDAESSYSYEEEVTEIKVNGFQVKVLELPNIIFRPINFNDDRLTVELTLTVDVNIECSFLFFTYDSIDKEDVPIGTETANTQTDLEAEVLITFVGDWSKIGAEFEVDDVEIKINAPASIDFGYVEPDWGDPDDEYYQME
jgi:rRNA-processing protein FCF1